MAKKSSVLVDDLVKHLSSLEKTRAKMENLYSQRQLSIPDIEKVYEALYIRTITYFEGFIEDLFFGLLTGKIKSTQNNVFARVQIKSEIIAREILLQGQKYIDWLPYEKTEKLAEAYFRGGRPFSILEKPDKKEIEKMLIIRNVIAHQSSYSKNKFEHEIISLTLPLLPKERTVAGFLRSQFRTFPTQTRFELYPFKIRDLAQKIAG